LRLEGGLFASYVYAGGAWKVRVVYTIVKGKSRLYWTVQTRDDWGFGHRLLCVGCIVVFVHWLPFLTLNNYTNH
jgi:hypothetical protein